MTCNRNMDINVNENLDLLFILTLAPLQGMTQG